MGSYVPPARRNRREADHTAPSAPTYTYGNGKTDTYPYTQSTYNNNALPTRSSAAYRQTTSYSAPGRPRAQVSPGDASPLYSSSSSSATAAYGSAASSKLGEASSVRGTAGTYKTPAQRALEEKDEEARIKGSTSASGARDGRWPMYDQPGTGSGSGSGYGYGSADRPGDRRDDRSSWNPSANSHGNINVQRSYSGPGRSRTAYSNNTANNDASGSGSGSYSSPALYVFGDSFVGPMKLLHNNCAATRTFKGASAKGLNNPNSAKQVAKLLTPAVNDLMGLEYGYVPRTGRWVLLIFGNVDLQINYLWQLQHKPLTTASFPPGTSLPPHIPQPSSSSDSSDTGPRRKNHVLANATETSLSGHALGPMLFVEAVAKAYTSYLEREIVNGPIGNKLRKQAAKAQEGHADPRAAKGKVLVAAALPPLVQDSVLARIPEKYVERLEDDHKMAQAALQREPGASESRWVPLKDRGAKGELADGGRDRGMAGVNAQMAQMTVDDTDTGAGYSSTSERPGTPPSTGSGLSEGSDGTSTSTRTDTVSSISTAPSSPPSTSSAASDQPKVKNIDTDGDAASGGALEDDRYSIAHLLAHHPPLCTLPIRAQMTDRYNELLRTYVLTRPDVLQWIDIAPSMRALDGLALTDASKDGIDGGGSNNTAAATRAERKEELAAGIVDRTTWACPIDPTNVHPLWEPTLPLWLEEMTKLGLPTGTWKVDEETEETKRAYEEDKRRRTDRRDAEWAAEAAGR